MKSLYLFLLPLAVAILFLSSCKNHTDLDKADSTFYLIQSAPHHEGFNGHLNWEGRKQALDLRDFFKDSVIDRIYIHPFSHARETVDSLAASHYVEPIEYHLGSVKDSVMALLGERKDFGRKVLMVLLPGDFDPVLESLGASPAENALAPRAVFIIRNKKGTVSTSEKTY